MHYNSLSAIRELNDRQTRKQVVLKVYLESALPLTDRQVMKALGFVDPNKVRPRINDLLRDFELSELSDKVIDEESGEKVRVCRISTPEEKRAAQERKEAHEQAQKVYQKPLQLTGFGVRQRITNEHLVKS